MDAHFHTPYASPLQEGLLDYSGFFFLLRGFEIMSQDASSANEIIDLSSPAKASQDLRAWSIDLFPHSPLTLSTPPPTPPMK